MSSLELPRAPTAIGSCCTVPKQGARCLANAETSISFCDVRPISFITFGWSPCTVDAVMWWKKFMRPSVAGASAPPDAVLAQGSAAVNIFDPSCTGVAATSACVGCTAFGASVSYVPGQLQLIGSPLLDVLKIRYCMFACAVIAHCMF